MGLGNYSSGRGWLCQYTQNLSVYTNIRLLAVMVGPAFRQASPDGLVNHNSHLSFLILHWSQSYNSVKKEHNLGFSSNLSSWGWCCSLCFCCSACCKHQPAEGLDEQNLDGQLLLNWGPHASHELSITFLSVNLQKKSQALNPQGYVHSVERKWRG